MEHKEYKSINKSVRKKDSMQLLLGKPVYTDDEIRAFLAGNLCRCSGYDGQLRGIRNYLNSRKQ